MLQNKFLVKMLQKSRVLFGIAIGLSFLHLSSVSRISFHLDSVLGRHVGTQLLSMSLIFWGAVLYLLWNKRHTLNLNSGVFSSFFGASLIALVIFKTISLSDDDSFLHVSPLISVFGLGLLASGGKGLKQYWQELFILFVLAVPLEHLIGQMIDLAKLTAQFVNYLLLHLGFEVSRQDVVVSLPTGSIRVDPGCSALRPIARLLQLSALILVMTSTSLIQIIIVPIVAILVAFIVNGIRVAVMALLVAYSSREMFEFWHIGTGAHTISMLEIMMLWVFCQFFIRQNETDNQDSVKL